MCGRYSSFGPVSVSREAKEALARLDVDLVSEINMRDDNYNICPTQRALTLVDMEGHTRVEGMRWGLIPSWAKDTKIGAKMINARSETVASKPAFRAAFKRRRCLVPASGYFEWTGEPGHKQPFYIYAPNASLLMFAGLWEGWKQPDDDWLHTYTVVTGEPGKVSGDVHDRQPVILPPEMWDTWLRGTPADATDILATVPEAELAYYPVTKRVSNPRSQGPELLERIDVVDPELPLRRPAD